MPTDPFNTSGGVVIQGDPVQALAAQVNRITQKNLYAPGPGQLTRDLAASALVLMQTISVAAAIRDPYAVEQLNALTAALSKDPVAYVAPRVTQITQALAVYGDQLGLKPASTGITVRDPRFAHKWDGWMWTGAVAFGLSAALVVSMTAKRLARRVT